MNTVLAILVIFALLPPRVCRPLNVVFVTPPGEEFTTEEQQQALSSIRAATAWWHDLSPIATDLTTGITSTLVLTDGDPLNSFSWLRERATVSEAVTIYVLDNSRSRRLLFGDSAGEAQDYYGIVAEVLYGLPGPEGLAETTAHELGHVLYGLGDRSPMLTDIMGDTATAYHMRFVGCQSLAAMGRPCEKVYLPGMASAPAM